MYKLPERGGGGEEVIWAMPERKHSFLKEVFPNSEIEKELMADWKHCRRQTTD